MTKVWDKPITADTDWGGDASTGGLPVSGRIVQEFIKDTLASIASAIKTDEQLEDLIKSYLDEKGITSDEGFVTLATEQIIKAVKDFEKGLKINGSPLIEYDAEKDALFLPTNLVVRGAITMFGDKGTTVPSIWASFPYDNETIKFNETTGKFYAVGGGSGGLDIDGVRDIIEGYDYVTIEDVDDKLKLYVDKTYVEDYFVSRTIAQDIKVRHDFTDGLKIDGLPMYKSKEDTIFLDANLVLRGSLTMFGVNTTTSPSIFASIPIDGKTIGRNEQGELYVIGGTGGGVADSVAWSNITGKPDWIGANKPSYSYSEITGTPDLTIYATQSSVDAISTKLNDFLEGEDADTIINKWKELESVLSGLKESDNLATILSGKADTAELERYILKDKAQSISAIHNFTNGLLIGDLPIKKSQDKTIYIDGNLVVSGAMTMFGKDSTTFPTIWANIPFNPDHMSWDGSQWSVVGGGGASVTKDSVINALGYTPYNATNPAGYITSSVNGPISASAYKLNVYTSDTGIYRGSYYTSALSNNDIAVIGGRTAIISNVSIGGWEASAKLHVHGDAKVEGTIYAGDNNGTIIRNANSNWIIGEPSLDGNIQIGTTSFAKARSLNNYHGSLSLTAEGGVEAQLAHLNSNPTLGSLDTNGVMRLTTKNGWGLYSWIRNTGRGYIQVGTDSRYGSTHKGYDLILQVLGGNIAIGGETAEEKLHVYGNVKANSFVGDIVCSTISNVNTMNVGQSFDLSHPTNGKQITLHPSFTVFAYENPIKGIPTYLDGLNVYIRTGANHTYTHTFKSNGDADFSNNIYAKRYFANEGFVLANTGVDYCGLIAGSTISSSGNAKDIWLYNSTADIKVYTPYTFAVIGGNVAVGGTTASEKLHVYGNLLTTGTITFFSQASLKNIINREGLSLDELAKIRPARFKWKDGRDDRVHVGVVADEIVDILPEVVYFTGEEKTMTVDYASKASFIATSLIAPVVNHEEEIKQLKKRVTTLENENKKLKQLIA